MAGEFLTGLTLGSDVGSKIADRRRQRRFEDALTSGDVQQAGLIDPQRLQQQQSLEAQRQEAQTAESTVRQQAALRAAQAIRNLAPRLGGDYRAAADMVVSKSGGLFGSPEELAGAVEFIGQNGEEGLAAIEASFGAPQKATQPVRPFEMSQDGRNVFATYGPDGSIQILGDAPQKAAAERNPLDDEYRRSQIEANKALAEQRRQPKAGAAAAGGTEQAREGVSQVLSEIGAAFNTLQQSNGVVVPGGDFRQNAVARLRSSGPGQVFGGTVGTQDQSVRERINNSRPLLINAIRQATGMSAKALDSNAELKFYLQAATDPTKDLYSNLAAIDALDRLYGLGGALDAVVPPEVLIEVRSQTGGAAPAAAEAPAFDAAKRARLEELRRKRDAGTLR